MDYIDNINVFTPLEYPKKLDALLFDKKLKKVNIICMHEAREIVKAKLWYNFLNQAVSDVNAMSRSVKRLCFIIISQFIRDISPDIRYTLNFYSIVRRPKGKAARLYINILWKDDRDLEKPKLRRRKLSGYLVINGRYKRFVPQYLELRKPQKEIVKLFEKRDYDAKAHIIKEKINKLVREMEQDIGDKGNKVNKMVDWYSKNLDSLPMIGRKYRNKWLLKPEIKDLYDLSPIQAREFQTKLNEKLKEKGVIENAPKEPTPQEMPEL